MALVCPRCGSRLRAEVIGQENPSRPDGPFRAAQPFDLTGAASCEIDRCGSCRGIWFDGGELEARLRLIAPADLARRVVPPSVPREEQRVDAEALTCPRCNIDMEAIRSRAALEVVFDRCPRCRGVWLDAGELKRFATSDATSLALLLDEFR